MSGSKGTLYLVPAPLDFGCDAQVPVTDVLPAGTLARAATLTHWICENAKTARAYLKRIGEVHPLAAPIQQHVIVELPREVHKKGDHGGGFDAKPLLACAEKDKDDDQHSEASKPAEADPGTTDERAAHELGITVVPLVGPGASLLSLAASGLGGQNFAFVGYLPQDASARAQRLRELETLALKSGQTQLFIETPYRNAAVWNAICQTLQPNTRVSAASGVTLPNARIATASVAQWRKKEAPVSNDVPAVFAIGR